jgi:hypothetical protein
MITINDFLAIEGNSYTKQVLLEAIERIKKTGIESEELIFNMYSIIFYVKKNEVIISDDICPWENPPVTFTLNDFCIALNNFEIE